jgi:hypothetical protein
MSNISRLFVVVCFLTSFGSAQVPAVRQGSFEIGGFVGSSYGLDHYRLMGGGNVSYGVTRYILPYVEYSYFPGIERDLGGTVPGLSIPYTEKVEFPVSDFHGGVHIRIPIRESKLVPYGVFGAGGLTFFKTTGIGVYTDQNGNVIQSPFTKPQETDFAINAGGGLRYYLGQSYGLRVEAKVYKPYGGSRGFNDVFGKVEFGFFIQLKQ